jgi:arylsulfatase A-like enzyme
MTSTAGAILLTALAATAPAESSRRPTNLVFIMTDDQGAWSLGCYGNDEARTAGVDRLAAEGLRFTRAFAFTPVCSPSRATFFTGRIPSQHGIHDWIRYENAGERARYCLPDEVLLSTILARHGYACGMVGKWHLGDSMTPHADHSFWFALPQGSSAYQNAEVCWKGELVQTSGYITDRITDQALNFLDAHKQRPFFLTVSYNAPHSPYAGHPAALVDQFQDCPFTTAPDLDTHPWSISNVRQQRTPKTLSQYYAACSGISRGVERIVDQLRQLGLTGSTLVVYTSDQGYCCGHHGLWGKGNASNPRNMYDTSCQIPLIFHHPGRIGRGKATDVMFSAIDFVPTVLEYLRLPPSPGRNLPGRSILPALEGKEWDGPDAVFGEYGRTRMIRTNDWKLVHRADGGPHELYDLQADPGEEANLAEKPEHKPRLIDLRDRLREWFAKYAESGSDPIGNEYLRPE